MKNRLRLALLLGMILIIVLSLAYWWGTPRLLEVFPPDGATAVPAGTVVRLTFSQSMREDSILDRLTIEPAVRGTFTWQTNSVIFTPDQPWPSGTNVYVHLEAGGLTSGLLALPLGQSADWSFRVRQPRLAYLYPSERPANIYVLDPLSGVSARLPGSPTGVLEFDVSSSGTEIYYSVRNGQGGSDIYYLELSDNDVGLSQEDSTGMSEGPSPVLMLSCSQAACRDPKVSPDGDYLAYERTAALGSDQPNYPQVWLLPFPDEGAVTQDASSSQNPPVLAGDPLHQTLLPIWSPDGLLTFYDANSAEYVILDLSGGESAHFPNQTGQPGDWHPNGRDYVAPEIFFVDTPTSEALSGLDPFANSHLILFNRLDGATEDLTKAEDLEDIAPAFSPDGTYLAFARKYLDANRWTPGRQLWLMHTGIGEAQPLTNDPIYNHFEFAWSPTGDQLVFVRFNQTVLKEPPEIWLIDPFTTRATQLIVGGYAPQWIP